jgi:hypothetical protein
MRAQRIGIALSASGRSEDAFRQKRSTDASLLFRQQAVPCSIENRSQEFNCFGIEYGPLVSVHDHTIRRQRSVAPCGIVAQQITTVCSEADPSQASCSAQYRS